MPANSFKWKHYAGEIILLNVRWYLKYALSYRNLKEMMTERGVEVDHTTIMGYSYVSCHQPQSSEHGEYKGFSQHFNENIALIHGTSATATHL